MMVVGVNIEHVINLRCDYWFLYGRYFYHVVLRKIFGITFWDVA